MRNNSRWLVLAVMAVTLAISGCAPQQSQARSEEAPQTPQQSAMVFQGSLVQVDTDAKILTVKDADNNKMKFAYTEGTEIVGAENTVQGLAGKSGERVKVTYTAKQDVDQASRIEILPYY